MGNTDFTKEFAELSEITSKLSETFSNIEQYHENPKGENYLNLIEVEAKWIKNFLIFLAVLTIISLILEVSQFITTIY